MKHSRLLILIAGCTVAASLAAAVALAARPTPDNGRLAFSSYRDGNENAEIYSMNEDGTDVRRLTNNPALDFDPSWMPPYGSKVAFESDRAARDGNFEIYSMNHDGTGVTRLTANAADDVDPDWSGDGKRIAFVSNRAGNNDVYVMNANGTGVTRLTFSSAGEYAPAWSPDGQKIAFISQRDGNNEVYVMNADGTGQTRLTAHPGREVDPNFSPDGRRIAFSSDRNGTFEIYSMYVNGTGVTLHTANDCRFDFGPVYSPDGKKIAFSHCGKIAIVTVGTKALSVLSDGGTPDWTARSPFGSVEPVDPEPQPVCCR